MPNWCNNFIEITGPKHIVSEIYSALKTGKFFGYFCPEPDYSITPVAPAFETGGEDMSPRIGDDTWWDWRVVNWGTKWELNIDDCLDCFQYEELSADSAVLKGGFDTAWSPGLEALAFFVENNPDVHILNYYFEPGCGFYGLYDSNVGESTVTIDNPNTIPDIYEDLFGVSIYFQQFEEDDEDDHLSNDVNLNEDN